jgi:hypothetical protein
MSKDDRDLFGENSSLILRIIRVCASVIWGAGGRIQATGLSIKFTGNIFLGILGSVGGGGPPILSAYQTIRAFSDDAKRSKFNCNVEERDLLKMKARLLNSLERFEQAFLKMPNDRKRICYEALQQISIQSDSTALFKIQTVFDEVILSVREEKVSESCITICSRTALRTVAIIPPSMIIIQLWLLTNTVLQIFSSNVELNYVMAALAISSYLLVCYRETQNTAIDLYNRTVGGLVSVERRKTESEVVFPKLSGLFDGLALTISIMPYAELISISERLVEEDTIFKGQWRNIADNTFVYGSYVGWAMIFYQAVQKLIIANLVRMYAQSRFSDADNQRTAKVLGRIEQIKTIIQESNLQSFRSFLKDLSSSHFKIEESERDTEKTPLISSVSKTVNDRKEEC